MGNNYEASEESDEEEPISYDDIVNFFPYLKNLESPYLEPNDFCLQ